MSDEQFDNYQHRSQSISEEKIENVQSGKRYTRKVQKKSGKQGNNEKSVIEEDNKYRRNARKNVSKTYPQDVQDEQKQGHPWSARQNVVEGQTEDEQKGEPNDRSWLTQRHDPEGHAQEEQEEQNDRSWLTQRHDPEGHAQEEQEEAQEDHSWLTQRHDPEGHAQEEQENEQNDRSWLTQRHDPEGHAQEEQEEAQEDRSWLTQKHIVEGYIEDWQDEKDTERRPRIKKNLVGGHAKNQQSKGDIEGQQDEKQSETPHSAGSIHYQLSSHFNFIHQIRKQYQKVTAAINEQSQQAARPSIRQQLRSQYQWFIAIINGQLQQVARSDFRQQLRNQYKEVVAAACFLSILPFPGNAQNFFSSDEGEVQPQVVIGSAYFPFVGLLIAIVACILPFTIGSNLHLPSLVLAALVTVALIWLTGGLHLDGLMDACDGLFGGSSRERKLEIMHDSHVGAFGVLGSVSVLLLKFAIFASLTPNSLAIALLMVLPIARWAIVLAMYLFFSARSSGLGATARKTVTLPRLLIAGLTSLLIALIVGHLIGLALWMAGTLVTIIVGTWTVYVLGGLTGDIYGAIAEVTEVVCFLMLLVMR
jgi:adenosylcobinamide-GDP ribazoletransferase